jgi:mono/diheme cytochrome c family protein
MKKLFTFFAIVGLGATMMFSSCGGGGADQGTTADTTKTDTVAANPYADLPADIQAMMPRGKELYDTKCFACHQKDGKGVANTFPPLASSDYLLADKKRAVAQTLNGSHEPMVVNGVTYTQQMTPQVDTKDDAVAVINYVLNNFGNKGGFITLAEVEDVVVKPRK